MNKRIVAVPLVLFMLAFLLQPISGVGQEIVHDPTNYANALIMLAELIKSYEQLKAQYELEFNNLRVVPVDMLVEVPDARGDHGSGYSCR